MNHRRHSMATACLQCKEHVGYMLSFGHQPSASGQPLGKGAPVSKIVFSRRASHKNTFRPKVENTTRKSKVCVSLRASVILKDRKSHRPFVPNRKWCFRVGHLTKTPSGEKSKILFVSGKWAFRLGLLSFCKVEHATGLQKVAFPSFWALEALVVLQNRTCHWSSESGISIFLGARSSCLSAK